VATYLRKTLSVNCWGVWFSMANKILLNDLYNKENNYNKFNKTSGTYSRDRSQNFMRRSER